MQGLYLGFPSLLFFNIKSIEYSTGKVDSVIYLFYSISARYSFSASSC
jgi:hypothetical protein